MPATEFIYGRNSVEEARRGRRRVHRVLTADDVTPDELARLAGSPGHQGVVAEVDRYTYASPGALLERGPGVILALDQVQDPRNLGAACRSAEAAGALGVVITERRAARVTPAAAKASAGAVEHLDVARVRNLADWLAEAKDAGAWAYGADAGAPQPYTSVDLSDGLTVLVLGGEGKGLRRRVAASCDALVSIPLAGHVESLNVSAAATVLLFEAVRQRDTPAG
jgi:23S rRNA (guanosine2251-2'-O)-methyltransferase